MGGGLLHVHTHAHTHTLPPPPSPPPGDLLLRHETLAHHHDDLMQVRRSSHDSCFIHTHIIHTHFIHTHIVHSHFIQRSVTFSALADEARSRLQEVSLLQRETKLKGHNDVASLQKVAQEK